MSSSHIKETLPNPDSPAINALGSLFKLTQIFICDDGYSVDYRQPSLPKHIRFKYDDDDDDDEDGGDDSGGKDGGNVSLKSAEDIILVDNDGVTEEMSALGLPLSFQAKSNKQNRGGQIKGKSKAAQHTQHHTHKSPDKQVDEPCKSNEEDQYCPDFQVKSSNSSSSSLLDQSEHSGSGSNITQDTIRLPNFCERHMPTDMAVDVIFDGPEELVHGSSPSNMPTAAVNDDSVGVEIQTEIEMMCVDGKSHLLTGNTSSKSNMLDDHLENDMCSTKQISAHGSILGTMSDLPEDSQNAVVLDQEHNDTGTCYGTCGDWNAYWDNFYSRYYFYNTQTNMSTWYPPPGMESFAPGESCCSVDESNVRLSGTDVGPSKDQNEEVQSIKYELLDKAACDNSNKTPGSVELDAAYLSSALCSDESRVLDDHNEDEITLKSLNTVEYNHTTEDLHMSEACAITATKHKSKKKSRRRKKSIKRSESNDFYEAEESSIDITKYWCQRYLLFSRFDDGIKMDEEGWFSVTPEAIARHHALRCRGGTVIDCFAGAGGNAIQFAKTSKHVVAIDIDPKKIEYACHNATIYGVENNIDFVTGDSLSLVSKLKADSVFLSPPWGGPDYVKVKSYSIHMLQPYDGQLLFDTFKVITPMIIMFLPRNVDLEQLAELSLSADPPWSLEVEKNFLNDKLKAVTAYFSRTPV